MFSRAAKIGTIPGLILVLGASAAGGAPFGLSADRKAGAGQGTAAPTQASRGRGPERPPEAQRATPPGLRPEWEWWNDAEFKKQANLAAAQVRRIDEIFQSRVRQMRPFAEEMVRELAVLDRMARERVASVDEYQVQAQRVEMLFGRVRESRQVMLYRLYKELTPEQYQKLRDAYEARARRRQQSRGHTP
jgi:Spy/CpxP family protein refolding chaperone